VQVEHRRLFLYSLCWSADTKKRVQLELEMLHYACLSFSTHPAGLFSYAHEYNSDSLGRKSPEAIFCFKYLISDTCLLDFTVEK